METPGWFINAGVFTNDIALVEQASYHQFLAAAKAVIYAHEHYPDLKVGCMIAQSPAYPYSCKPEDVMAGLIRDNFYPPAKRTPSTGAVGDHRMGGDEFAPYGMTPKVFLPVSQF